MYNELVTIIIPVYNVKDYLEECLDSVIFQTYKNLEIIIIDDGSEDTSLEIVKEYSQKDYRIKFESIKNSGQGLCRNRALSIAKGDYIFFMDSDDYLDRDTIKVLLKEIITKQSDILVYNAIAFDDYADKYKFHENKYFKFPEIKEYSKISGVEFAEFGISFISPCMKLYNRNFLIENRILFTEGKYGEDVEFWYKCCLLSNNIEYIDFVGYYRRYRPNSTMTGSSIRVLKDRIDNLNNLRNIILSVDNIHKKAFEKNLSGYALSLYREIFTKNNAEFKELIKLFKENKGRDIINLGKFKMTTRIKKNIYMILEKIRDI